MLSSKVPTAAASATRLARTLNFSFIIRHPSSIFLHLSSNYSFLFVSRLFFTQK
jgi:hypothetical protein